MRLLPDGVSRFIHLLQVCIEKRSLVEGRNVHREICKHGLLEDGDLGNAIVRMYVKCKSPKDAQLVFDRMLQRTMVLWTTMVAGYISAGDLIGGWTTFRRMQQEGVHPEKVTFVSILNACHGFQEGKFIHGLANEKGLDEDVVVGNALVKMYSKCRRIDCMVKVFKTLPERDVISWTGMITAFAQNGHYSEAFFYYLSMLVEGVPPSRVSFLAALRVCNSVQQVKMIHDNIVEAGIDHDFMLVNALVFTYSRCGSLESAKAVFETMKLWNVVTFNTVISACVQHGCHSEAFGFFQRLQAENMVPDQVTFVSVLGACVAPEDLAKGKDCEILATVNALEMDVVVGTAFVNMYIRCGSLPDARRMFEKMDERNIVSWNTMLAGYSRDESYHKEGVKMFREMLLLGVSPSEMTFVYVVNTIRDVRLGRLVHSCILESRMQSDIFICNSLVAMFGKCGTFGDACSVFQSMPEKDVVSWNGMLSSCIEHRYFSEAVELYAKMQLEGTSGNKSTYLTMVNAFASPAALEGARKIHTYIRESGYECEVPLGNAVMSMYSKCGGLADAMAKFHSMEEKSVVSWTTIIAACTQNGLYEEALQFFNDMDFVPDKITFIAALEACTLGSTPRRGRQIHAKAIDLGLELDVFVGTELVHMYSKFGNMEEAAGLFRRLPLKAIPSWNAMIGGYAQNAQLANAEEVFWEMQQNGSRPDQISFLSMVSAYSHAGLVEDGIRTFASMWNDFNVVPIPENYSCLIDLLARAGRLEEAGDFVETMPCKPSDGTWKAMLSGCRVQGNLGFGKSIVDRVLEMEPRCAAAHVELSNLLSEELNWA